MQYLLLAACLLAEPLRGDPAIADQADRADGQSDPLRAAYRKDPRSHERFGGLRIVGRPQAFLKGGRSTSWSMPRWPRAETPAREKRRPLHFQAPSGFARDTFHISGLRAAHSRRS